MSWSASPAISLIRLAVQRLAAVANEPISTNLKEKVSLAIIDYLGAIASGKQAPWAQQVCEYARIRRGAPESFSWGIADDTSTETAAFVNAILAHSAIRDDMHLKSNSHIGSIVISAALALAQRDNWTGEQVVRAIIGGYEVAAILGVAVQQSRSYNHHFRPSGICGSIGAAGAAITASLMSSRIDEGVAVNALAFAADMSSGYNEWAWAGGLEIYAQMGRASQAGIVAFDLASTGMQCSDTVLEGTAGLFAALSASEGIGLFRAGLQTPIGQALLDVRFKPGPACNYALTPLATALRLARRQPIDLHTIENVTVVCTSGAKRYPGCNNPGPFTTVQQTKMSIQFGVCAVLVYGELSETLFRRFEDLSIIKLAVRCKLETDEQFDESFREGRQPARVVVALKDGTQVSEELTDVPWLDGDAVRKRFYSEMASVMPSEEMRQRLVNTIGQLEAERDCTNLVSLFREIQRR